MQGRLVPPEPTRFQSFPRTRWRDEFPHAAAAGLNAIEWIYDLFGEDVNPIASDAGIAEMRALEAATGVEVVSICADYFMDRPILRASENERRDIVARLYWILERGRRAGVIRIVLPFVDASRIQSDDDEAAVVATMREILPAAVHAGIELHLETALAPAPFARLLAQLDHPLVKVNYDSGNSAGLGFDPREEFAAYGRHIGSVHIKDRKLGGGTVPLGTGDANLDAVFAGLEKLGYAGDYILQAARSEPGAEVALAAKNRAFIVAHVKR